MARQLRALGEQGVRRGPRPAIAANPAGLTRRETEVLRLLSVGLTNAKIAAQLGLSTRTVDNHVSATLRKLGGRTRGDASAQAAPLGLTGPSSPPLAADGNHPPPDGLGRKFTGTRKAQIWLICASASVQEPLALRMRNRQGGCGLCFRPCFGGFGLVRA